MTTQQPICPACFGSTTNIHNQAADEPCPYCCGAGSVSLKMAQDYASVRFLIAYAPLSPIPSELKPYADFIKQERKAMTRKSITLYAQYHQSTKIALMDSNFITLAWYRNVDTSQEALQTIASDQHPSIPANEWVVRWERQYDAYKISWEAEHAHA